MSTPGDRFRSALLSRRGRADDRLYARATPEKVEVTESYSVRQEISKSPYLSLDGDGTGRIELEVPYDGRDYFTRQAADDVERGPQMPSGAAERKAIIGHLLLMDHAKTDLRNTAGRHNQAGVIPIAIPVSSSHGDLKLTDDRRTCVIWYEYQPENPAIYPIDLEIELYDPDNLTLDFDEVEASVKNNEGKVSEVIETLRQAARFSSELLLSMIATISIPVKKESPRLYPMVKRMSVAWPTITSLSTTRLDRSHGGDQGFRTEPVRYNPADSRLEWEDIPVLQPAPAGDDADGSVRIYRSELMLLNIGHPGELFKSEKLEVKAEVEIPGYLLSGLEAPLFDATGRRQGTQPKLTTRLSIHTSLYPADVFAKRTFSPYQRFVFDEIVPDEMRITDIVTVLRNLRFDVNRPWSAPGNSSSQSPQWLITAKRSQGPDSLDLLVAVEGMRREVEREQLMPGHTVRETRKDKASGQLEISVLGMLPRDHGELTREMNALQQAVRNRFRLHQGSRR
jgi:hypothetical protein